MKNHIITWMQSLLPRRLYCLLWAPYYGFMVCRDMLFTRGFLRSCCCGASLDGQGNPQPWYTFPAVEYLKGRDISGMDVFEFGAGYSTAWYSRNARRVLAVESDLEWQDKTRCMVGMNAAIVRATTEAEYAATINRFGDFDIIAIDGVPEWRLSCAKAAINRLRPGGMIILDNSDVHADVVAFFDACGLLRVDFWGYAPNNHTLMCTTIYFDLRKST